jgi:predicted nucleic-acid-binding Zn-ribbon protein
MIKSGMCPKCGCTRIAGPHRMESGGMINLPSLATATCEAFTCTDCGYTELYSDEMGLRNIRKFGRFMPPVKEDKKAWCQVCGAELQPDAVFCPRCESVIE